MFIEAIKTGKVKIGSYLIVESLDRISRTEVIDVFEILLKIIRAGINIVTLTDSHVYSKDSIRVNFTKLIISISVMSRAHEV
ncbi:recombinase family protein [Rhodocyclus gracilis]|uniref:recombinase family protein n=1 Tax=Rhodocyclus gracilis TaxID=2929842 RepID=UPI001297CE21